MKGQGRLITGHHPMGSGCQCGHPATSGRERTAHLVDVKMAKLEAADKQS